MTDVYKRLAERLDQLPYGYPATESGVELKILQKIFKPEDAEMALKMKYFKRRSLQGHCADRRRGSDTQCILQCQGGPWIYL
jgi:hypothetical protein